MCKQSDQQRQAIWSLSLQQSQIQAHINRELGAPANFGSPQAFFDDVDAPDACISLRRLARPRVVHLGTLAADPSPVSSTKPKTKTCELSSHTRHLASGEPSSDDNPFPFVSRG
ncbi:uncharacterized protein QC761_0021460 [Podospora bellae-mahoneyi]|uniref:Uncharacterized protein n=1 Tax=Podospora bellae-mahoneyi TaxID=2093777 RepID=A0ABR0G136_9PEZI|nr:hypothetical protein QC761_0021460 [Podospora bellae-mahoneyi]